MSISGDQSSQGSPLPGVSSLAGQPFDSLKKVYDPLWPPPSSGHTCPVSSVCLNSHGPKFLLHPVMAEGACSGTTYSLSFACRQHAGDSPEAATKGGLPGSGLPGNCFREKTGWDCYPHLYSAANETKGNTGLATEP